MAVRHACAVLAGAFFVAGCSKAPRGQARMDSLPEHEARADLSASLRTIEKSAASPRPTARGAELDPASVAVLKQAIESKDYATRLIAIEAIGDVRAEALLPWLEHALGDPEHDVRMATVEALEKFHSPRAFALLVTVRDDTTEDLDVRALAASSVLSPHTFDRR